MMASCGRNHLPEDLMIGFLLGLPVKSLLRFRCVSKSWCAIITSRDFRYQHLNNSRAGGLLLALFYSTDRIAPDFNVYFPDETLSDLTHHAFDVPNIPDILHGPCNGIFLVTFGQYRYALWNPATKEYRQLPDPGLEWTPGVEESFGFGLDPITGDYKVVILKGIEDQNIFLVGKVHTLGTQHWKDLKLDFAEVRCMHRSLCHTYLNGAYYFHARNSRALSFDMATDAFEVIPPPNELEPVTDTYIANECFAVFQDTIALFHVRSDENCLRVWMLKEKSWIKHFTVELQSEVKFVTGCWNNKILLQSYADRLLLYNLTTQEIRDLGFQGTSCCKGIHSFKESLISIEEEYERRRQRESET